MSETTTPKRCIITGAGTGIGRACSLALVESPEIHVFVLISLGIDNLEETRTLMRERNETAEILVYDQDITEYDRVREIVDRTYARFGSVDILLNVAGFAREAPFLDTSIEVFKRTYEINVFALFAITQAVARHMKASGGVIVNIASTSGSTPRVDWLAYASSKSAVIGISRTLAHELKDYNIKVFNVSPGRCATAMRRSLRPNEDEREIMQPGSVGAMVAFLVRNPECNVDGQDIVVRQI